MEHPQTKSWTDPEGVEHTASVIYQDLLGNAWYSFDNPMRMPAGRTIAAELANEFAKMNITPDDLRAYVNDMMENGDKGKIVDMFYTLRVISERLNWMCEGRSLLELANCYFTINEEPLNIMVDKYAAMKRSAWDSDPDCRAFFLRSAFVLTKGYLPNSEVDIPDYLAAQEYVHLRGIEAIKKRSAPDSGTKKAQPFLTRKGKS